MIVLDENITESQRQLLRSWRIAVRQIGYEVGRKGMQDDEIIPFLLQLRRPTALLHKPFSQPSAATFSHLPACYGA